MNLPGKSLTQSLTQNQKGHKRESVTLCFYLAGGRGFEPRQTESESVVLPLDDPPVEFPVHNEDDGASQGGFR